MRFFILFAILGCFLGCSSTQQTIDTSIPQLLTQEPLPPLPKSIDKPLYKIEIEMLIIEDGSVDQVRLLTSSGSTSWDSLATATIHKWRFSPAREKGKPIRTWLRQRAPVQYAVPQYLFLAEILCTTMQEADSISEALGKGQDFNKLAMQCSVDSSREQGGIIGEVNIYNYPENIRHLLSNLKIDEITQPVRYGDRYVIFKRLNK